MHVTDGVQLSPDAPLLEELLLCAVVISRAPRSLIRERFKELEVMQTGLWPLRGRGRYKILVTRLSFGQDRLDDLSQFEESPQPWLRQPERRRIPMERREKQRERKS